MDTYDQEMHCSNCSATFIQSFKKGTRVGGSSYECKNCGCPSAKSVGMPQDRGFSVPETIRLEIVEPDPRPLWQTRTGDAFGAGPGVSG